MTGTEKPWTESRRVMMWVKVTAMAIPIAGALATCGIATAKWGWTRASVDDVVVAVEPKADKEAVKETVKQIEHRIGKSERLLSTVHVNLIRLMEHSDVTPNKPVIDFADDGVDP